MRKRRRRVHSTADFELQITSLADILIIMLVFLLKSFSTGVANDVNVPNGIKLPHISSGEIAKPGLTIEISKSFVQVQGQKVVSLSSGKFSKSDLNQDLSKNGTSKTLREALKREVNLNQVQTAENVWVIADRDVPYRTVQTVLASAAVQGFSDFKLAVIKKE